MQEDILAAIEKVENFFTHDPLGQAYAAHLKNFVTIARKGKSIELRPQKFASFMLWLLFFHVIARLRIRERIRKLVLRAKETKGQLWKTRIPGWKK